MEPGIYPHLSNEEYHASNGVSRSGISLLLKCPELYHKRVQKEATPSMMLGSALHTAILEQSKFSMEYVVAPMIDKRSKSGKDEWIKFQSINEGKTVLSRDDYDRVMRMQNAVSMHPVAGEIFDYPGQAEVSFYAEHEYTKELCKVRPDWIQSNILVDLKSTSDASPEAFSRSCYNFDYHIQSGMYLKVCRDAGMPVDTFLFVCVENKEPYSVAVYVASRDMIELGEQRFHQGMSVYKECKDSGIWPGYGNDKILTIDLPAWAYKKDNFVSEVF